MKIHSKSIQKVYPTALPLLFQPSSRAALHIARKYRLLPHVDVEGSHVLTPAPAFAQLDGQFVDEVEQLELVG